LSFEETGRLEHYGIWPSCKAHLHVSKTKALEMVAKAETHRFVGGPDTRVGFVSAIMRIPEAKIWEPVACHDWSGRALQGYRTWGVQPTR
jgi:hypothetical protein